MDTKSQLREQTYGPYKPLMEGDIERIHQTALKVLENIGMADPIPIVREKALEAGCWINDSDRLCFPAALIEDMIAGARRDPIRFARDPKHDIDESEARVYNGPAGISAQVLDVETGQYRTPTLLDSYDFARLADYLDNINMTSPWMSIPELADPVELDVNRAYTLAAGSTKHMLVDISTPESVEPMIALFDTILGEEGAFIKRPFAMIGACTVIHPLQYCDIMSEAIVTAAVKGVPVEVAPAPQLGSTAPTAIAGGLVQMVAETMASLAQVRLVAPDSYVEVAVYPFITDLRSGLFSGGGGEQALASAAAAQICRYYDLPHTVGGGMTDSKVPDFQAGLEKGLTAALIGVAGADSIGMSTAMMGSAIGASLESMVVDDEIYGMVNSAIRLIEVNDDTLSYEVIEETIKGDGHYLGHPQTLHLMRKEFYYPKLADRSSPHEWMQKGSPDYRETVRDRLREIMRTHYPTYIDPKTDDLIRKNFPIRIAHESMSSDSGRW